MSNDSLVYVVDDDEASADSLRVLLSAKGYRVRTFNSAETFLDLFDVSEGGCLVLDARLENMNGLALQRELVNTGKSLPTILISGHADETLRKQAIANGALALLEKPFASNELCDRIENALTAADK